MESSSNNVNQYEESPLYCAYGCGFYGSEEKLGLCSKCYNLYLETTAQESVILGKDLAPSSSSSDDTKINIPDKKEIAQGLTSLTVNSATDDHNKNPPVPKNRCSLCRRKVGLLGFECRCGGGFCGRHRYPEAHNCTAVDFKEAAKVLIQNQNPTCKSDKMPDRI